MTVETLKGEHFPEIDQIGERIKEKIDWREYVKDSPYFAIRVAAGLIKGALIGTATKPATDWMRKAIPT
jgi:ElaB/YqjD/DUF883 family membrane-anchored ribosome-binding protein